MPPKEDSERQALEIERETLRSVFMASRAKFYKALENGDPTIGRIHLLLKDKYERLTIKNSEFLNKQRRFMDATQLANEIKSCEKYHDSMVEANFDVEQHMAKKSENDTYRLPKLQLQQFQLSAKTWLPFWAQFKRIHENANLDYGDKFQYLLMSLQDGPAKDMVMAYPRDSASFERAIESLRARFGRETMLIELYTRELISIVINKDFNCVSSLYDKLSTQLRALEGLGMTTEKCAFILYPLVESCLPAELLKVWERQRRMGPDDKGSMLSLNNDENYNPLDDLMKFLADEVSSEERIKLAVQPFNETSPPRPTAAVLISTDKSQIKELVCIFCDKQHNSHECFKAQSLDHKARESIIIKKGACFRCLKRGHRSQQCKASVKCLLCNKRHYVLMCRDRQPKEKGRGEEVVVRALLDDGAQRSYIAQSVVDKMKLKPTGTQFISHGLFGGVDGPSKLYNIYTVEVESCKGIERHSIEVVEQSVICHDLTRPSPLRDPTLFAALAQRGVSLSDVGDNPPPVEMLLGADVLGRILTGGIHVLPNGITAVETRLGWSVMGVSSRKVKNIVTLCLNAFSYPEKMWDLEAIGINEPVVPVQSNKLETNDALVHFENTVKKKHGRYVVELPWKAGHPPLNDNFNVVYSRLQSTTERLKRENLYDHYDNIFQQWLKEGIIEPVTDNKDCRQTHFLAHRPVIKAEKTSSKVRPVFDASARSLGSGSLNDCLFKGNNLMPQIPSLLVQFRLGKYGVTADIKQAFLQIVVAKKDRDVLRFLWWEKDGKLKMFRHCRVVFGVKCSPFLLNATIAYHLNIEKAQESDVITKTLIDKLLGSFYVDDSVSSFDNKKEVDEFIEISKTVMDRGKFELRRWTSNATWVEGESQEAMILGLRWDLKTDTLRCVSINTFKNTGLITKRGLLGLINAIYDPIGMLCPALLPARMMLQDTWKMKIGWDEPLPDDKQKEHNIWARSLPAMEELKIPRHLCSGPLNTGLVSLHVFSDASQKGYGCCVYLRHEIGARVSLQLVSAKSRVAPLQNTTIPRMELLGACLGVRLRRSLLSIIDSKIETYFWTDSMTVLAWVTKALIWGTFVGNRVKEIRNGSDVEAWRYVPGTMNPADLASRGCTVKQLIEWKWWEGPSWLKENKSKWPITNIECPNEALAEIKNKKINVNLTTLNLDDDAPFTNLLTRYFSSYLKMLRMVAWMVRFGRQQTIGPLSTDEVIVAERKVLILVQRESDCHVQGVSTHRDTYGLLRVTSRVVNEDRDTSLIILPSKHVIVGRLIYQTHIDLQHAGVGSTLARIRERFWLINGRRTVKQVLAGCIVCKKLLGRKGQPEPSDLPVERTSALVSPFWFSGADLFGPMYLKDGCKVWGILFTCAVYRCVRLDLVDSLSSESLVRGLRRFLARNNCLKLYTDNGTNFKGLSNAFKVIDWQSLANFTNSRHFKMIHTPPASPWYGGFYERLVGVVKLSLKKQVGAAALTRDELQTVLIECEAVVNNRPLTYISDDAQDLRAITPAHFLQETPLGDVEHELDVHDEQSLIKRVQYVQNIRAQLRERFVREYLTLLVQRNRNKVSLVEVGEIVLIEAENKKRQLWPMGRVVEIYPSRDGNCRVVRLRTQHGELVRPLQRLIPLELKSYELPSMPITKVNPSSSKGTEVFDITGTNSEQVTRLGRTVKPPKKLDL